MNFSIKLQDNTYYGTFNLNVVRNFCRVKDYKNIDEYLERVAKIDFQQMNFSDIDDILTLVVLGVDEQARIDHSNVAITIEDIYAEGIGSISGALNALVSTMPQAEEGEQASGNVPKAAKKQAGTASKK